VIDSKTIDRMEMGNKTEGIRHVAERETIKWPIPEAGSERG
jgi:hypothetical protein